MRIIGLYILLLAPNLVYSQEEIDTLYLDSSPDSIGIERNDSLIVNSEIETTVNYVASDSIYYNMENQKISMYGNSNIDLEVLI